MPRLPLLLPELADEYGLVGVGGDLSPGRLLDAYRHGVFPWYDEQTPILWWSPDPRAVFELDRMHFPRRLQRTIRSGRFTVTVNRDFGAVIRACAVRPGEGTWITPDMIEAYERLHRLGHAHSVEVWRGDVLGGGIYGVGIGGFFAGESMFTRVRDGSKVALAALAERLRERGFTLFDTQFVTDHTRRFGAIEIPRDDYLARLRQALVRHVTFV
jgi:leucyl/phenylalanyl-tRNA--protein transferase